MIFWPDERTERLKKLWADGLTASQIAAELGGISRNSVIGKVWRLNLPGRPNRSANLGQDQKPKSKRKKPSLLLADNLGFARFKSGNPKPPPPLPPEPDMPVDIAPIDTRCSILELNARTCRWPIGNSKKPLEPIFCGGKTIEGLCYCGHHERRSKGRVEELGEGEAT